jgi:hypothetical protein
MLVVDTNPLQDRTVNSCGYGVSAYIDDRSETGLVSDSLLVFWRLAGSPDFDSVMLQATAYPDSYYAEIPMQADSVNIDYYVFARDNSGRRSTRPPIAPRAWYTFNTGAPDVSGVADAHDVPASCRWRLAQNSPNPFRGTTEISYSVPVVSHVRLDIYDVRGRHIATPVDEHQTAGRKVVRWRGIGADGRPLPGGVYYCSLRSRTWSETKAMVLLR